MKEVSKDMFYNTLAQLDVVLSITTGFPYTTDFSLRNHTLKGKVIESWTNNIKNRRPIITKYYVV